MSKYQRFQWCPTSTWVVSVLRELRYKWDLLLVPFYEKWRLDMIRFMKLFTPNWSGNLCPKMVVKVQHFFLLEHSNLANALCLCSKKLISFLQTFGFLITQVTKLFSIPHLSFFYAQNFQKSHLESGNGNEKVALFSIWPPCFQSPKGTFFHWKWTRIACYKYNALVKVTPDAPKAIMEGKGVVYLLGSPILSRFACIVIGSRNSNSSFSSPFFYSKGEKAALMNTQKKVVYILDITFVLLLESPEL